MQNPYYLTEALGSLMLSITIKKMKNKNNWISVCSTPLILYWIINLMVDFLNSYVEYLIGQGIIIVEEWKPTALLIACYSHRTLPFKSFKPISRLYRLPNKHISIFFLSQWFHIRPTTPILRSMSTYLSILKILPSKNQQISTILGTKTAKVYSCMPASKELPDLYNPCWNTSFTDKKKILLEKMRHFTR